MHGATYQKGSLYYYTGRIKVTLEQRWEWGNVESYYFSASDIHQPTFRGHFIQMSIQHWSQKLDKKEFRNLFSRYYIQFLKEYFY